MKFVLATANPGKIREMQQILKGLGLEITTRQALGIDIDVEETGSTFMENALLKAGAICGASGLPAIADDSGLMVDALGGGPGVYSSSYGGEHLSDRERCAFLLEKIKNKEQRGAEFVCTIACKFPDGGTLSAEGRRRGDIADAPRGSGGFGYDSVFIVQGLDKTMAELSENEKNAVSHRGEALRKFALLLQERMRVLRSLEQ